MRFSGSLFFITLLWLSNSIRITRTCMKAGTGRGVGGLGGMENVRGRRGNRKRRGLGGWRMLEGGEGTGRPGVPGPHWRDVRGRSSAPEGGGGLGGMQNVRGRRGDRKGGVGGMEHLRRRRGDLKGGGLGGMETC